MQELADQYGWLGQHTYNPSGSDRWVHCELARDGRLIVAELLLPGQRLTPSQTRWQAVLRTVRGVEVETWTPEDIDAITTALRGDAPCTPNGP